MNAITLMKMLDYRPQLTADEHGREESIWNMMVHYYTSHGTPHGTALEIVDDYFSALKKKFGVN